MVAVVTSMLIVGCAVEPVAVKPVAVDLTEQLESTTSTRPPSSTPVTVAAHPTSTTVAPAPDVPLCDDIR